MYTLYQVYSKIVPWYYDFFENGYYLYTDINKSNRCEFIMDSQSQFQERFLKMHLIHPFSNDSIWKPVEIIFNDKEIIFTDTNNNEYISLEINFPDIVLKPNNISGCINKKYINEIISIYKSRNKKILQEQNNICNYIDENIIFMSNNTLNLINKEDVLSYRLISVLYFQYSHTGYRANYNPKFPLFERVEYKKGKEKKEAEKFNLNLCNKIYNVSDIVNNLVEIIIEEKNIKPYIGRAIAWEAIQRTIVNFYGNKWVEEFEPHLKLTYDQIYKDNSTLNIDIINVFSSECAKEYIKNVIECEKIDIDTSKEILMYFLLYKSKLTELNIYNCFVNFYDILKEIKQKVESNNIKNKIKTKQIIKPSKYTIDDIDLMTGFEFENFIELLFSKMGYSSYVTKKSGDQGIDVIAVKDNIKIGIQTKCYSFTVGNSAIQEAVAGKSFYNCTKVIVITNNFFTNAAKELARSNNVILWDREMLKEKIKELCK
ncbi:MAG: restriction endonuclease [Clostridiales bacterium]|nr:restriction endonuclease [Clostridiales bacterium]